MRKSMFFALVFCAGCGVETDSPVEVFSEIDSHEDRPFNREPPTSPWLMCGDSIVHEVIVDGVTYLIEEPVACTESVLPEEISEDPRGDFYGRLKFIER